MKNNDAAFSNDILSSDDGISMDDEVRWNDKDEAEQLFLVLKIWKH